MNITRVQLTNFRSYASLDFVLPDGVAAIVGPNGAGKSSILVAIEIALFGTRSLENYLRRGGSHLEITLELEHGGYPYRIRREFFGGRSSLDFDYDGDPDGPPCPWEPLTLASQRDTQALIESTFGLSRDTFRASAYLAQGDSAALTNARPAERMTILRNTLGGLDVYDRAHTTTKARLATVRTDVAELAGSIRTLEGDLAGRPAVVEELARAESERQISSQRLAARTRAAEEAAAAYVAVERRIGEERAAREERRRAAHNVWEAESSAARSAVQVHTVASAQRAAAIRQRDELGRQAHVARTEALTLRVAAQNAEDAGPGGSRCRECGQLLDAESLAASIGYRRERANDLGAQANDLLQRAQAIAIPDELEPPPPVPAWEEPVEGPVPDYGIANLRADANRAAALVEEERGAVAHIGRRLAVTQDRLAKLDEAKRRLDLLADERAQAARDGAVLETVAEMFSPTGIPLLILENAIPLIEMRAQEVLERLGGQTADCRIVLQTQRSLKTSEILKDTLDIVIELADGSALPYEAWSGGERMRLDLAVRIGLAQLLLLHGANVELFAIDEPDGLDAQGRAALVDVVEEMGARYGFAKVLVISHDDSLREAFAQSITVLRGEDGTSAIAGSRVEVAA